MKWINNKVIKWVLTRFGRKNYDIAKASYLRKLSDSDLQAAQPPLLIYQMGKVGSSTVYKSLQALKLDMPIYHPHFLTPELIETYEAKRKQYFGTERMGDLKHIWQCEYLSKQIKKGLNGKKWKVVTLVRDPIARNVSAFFETLEVKLLNGSDQYKIKADSKSVYSFEIITSVVNVAELSQLFVEKFDHDTPLVFFDREVKVMLDIDVFLGEFPKSKGYKIYHGKYVDVLLIKLENLNDCAPRAFKEFLDIDGFTLVNTNIGSEKNYAPIYQKLKNSITLPDVYIDEMYKSKYARHFYSEAEIEKFKTKWCKPEEYKITD
ncbi:MAG TPA: putative capsular polysaccharide synthesis family protein, partial [Anaerolineae bacterium]|nr:putative capsular polysaccharide synthesis family protein [Anaerolineae bacterium]